jgi:hypothetical protein
MAANEISSQTKVKLTFDGLSTDIKALIIDKVSPSFGRSLLHL